VTATCTPTLSVAGLNVPAAAGGALVGIEEMTIGWGRSSVLSAPTPATATLVVLDTSADASFARRTDLLGQPVLLSWATPADATAGGYNFRGRITDVDVSWLPGVGMRVALACSSKLADCGNYTVPKGTTFPVESLSARGARILSYLPAGFFAGGLTLPTLAAAHYAGQYTDVTDLPARQANAQDVSGADVLSLLRQLFASAYPAPMVYDPKVDALSWAPERNVPYQQYSGTSPSVRLMADPAAGGKFSPVPESIGNAAQGGVGVPATALAYDGEASQPIDSRITRVEVTYRASATTTGTVAAATVNEGPLEASIGRRTLTVDAILSASGIATDLAAAYASWCQNEGRFPRIGPLVYRTSGGAFDSVALASLLLAGTEKPAQLFVRGSWLTRLQIRPLFGVIGGSISYADGEWSIGVTPAPVTVETPTDPLKIVYSAKASLGVKLADLDPALTFGDLRFVDIGAGFTYATQPPWGTG
jgi:hypothetical protein